MRKTWFVLALYICISFISMRFSRSEAQSNCFGGPVAAPPTNIEMAAPILKIGKFKTPPPDCSAARPLTPNARRTHDGDAGYSGGDVSNTAPFGSCALTAYPSSLPRIAGPVGSTFPQITNPTALRFIIAAEEPTVGPNGETIQLAQLETLTLKFYSSGCGDVTEKPFLTISVPVSSCVLTNGYYVLPALTN